jgi:alkylation response protein AidB-like acyl-CoA dehydrogenase
LADNVDPEWQDKCDTRDRWAQVQRDFDRRLYEGGWAGLWWPKEYGGLDASPSQKVIFEQERARWNAPDGLAFFGRRLLGPAIMKFGSEEQRTKLLPTILRGDVVFCQGSSEPNAGSDLAGVATTAKRAGDRYIVNGTKIWTSWAQYMDWCFALTRTDPSAEKHAGLTLLLIDLKQPGIEIRPLRKTTGSEDFTQVFFTNAETPATARVGAEGQGWEVMRYMLSYERGATAVFSRLVTIERHLQTYRDASLECDAELATLARFSTEVAAIRLLAYRVLSNQINGGEPGPVGSVVKLYWADVWQRMADQTLLFGGEEGLTEPFRGPETMDFPTLFLNSRCATVSGGSAEVQRNIVAQRVLGLPRQHAG